MRTRFLLVALIASGCLSSEASPTGGASGACYCWSGGGRVAPLFSRSAALNTRIFVWLPDKSPVDQVFSRVGGENIPFTATPAGAPDTWWLTPDQPLEPDTTYQLAGSDITTGDTEDHTPPQAASVELSDEGRAGICNNTVGSALRITGAIDDGAAATEGLIAQLDMTSSEGGVHRVFLPFNVDTNPQVIAFGSTIGGNKECLGIGRFDAVEGAWYDVTVTLWDSAGNSTVFPGLKFQATRHDPAGCPSGVVCQAPPVFGPRPRATQA